MTLAPHPFESAGVLGGFGLGALWMVLVWALPVIAIVALVAALSKNKA